MNVCWELEIHFPVSLVTGAVPGPMPQLSSRSQELGSSSVVWSVLWQGLGAQGGLGMVGKSLLGEFLGLDVSKR